MNMLMNINQLLEDISVRHACKNVSKYAAELERVLGIKLVPACRSLVFRWSKDYEWFTDASDTRDYILDYFKRQKPKMFSVEDYNISGQSRHYKLFFLFKFHPENAAI